MRDKYNNKTLNLLLQREDKEIEELIDEIENKQFIQATIIQKKDAQISKLLQDNKRLHEAIEARNNVIDIKNQNIVELKNLVSKLQVIVKQLQDLNKENQEQFNIELAKNRRNFNIEMDQRISEAYEIMNVIRQIDEQNREIKRLMEINNEQKQVFEEYENEDNEYEVKIEEDTMF